MAKQNGNSFVYDNSKSFEVNVTEQFGGLSREDLFFVKEYEDAYEKLTTGNNKHEFARAVSKLYRILFIENKKDDALTKELVARFNGMKFLTKTKNFNCLVSGLYRYNILNKKAFSKVKTLQIPKCTTDLLNKIGNVLYEYYTNGTDVYDFIKSEYKKRNIDILTKYFSEFEEKQKLDKENALLLLTFLTDKFGVLMFDEYQDVKTKFKVNNPNKNKGKNDKGDNKDKETDGGKKYSEDNIPDEVRKILNYLEIPLSDADQYKDMLKPYMEKIAVIEDKLISGDLHATKEMIGILDECKAAIQSKKNQPQSQPKPMTSFSRLIDRGILGMNSPTPVKDTNVTTDNNNNKDKKFEPNYDISIITKWADSPEERKILEDIVNEAKISNVSDAIKHASKSNNISRETKDKLKEFRFENVTTVENLYSLLSDSEPNEYETYLDMYINIKPQRDLYDRLKVLNGGKEDVMNKLKKMLETLK